MVPFDNLVRIYCETPHKNDMEAMKHLEIAFEKGMIEVLKEIAYTELLKYEKRTDNLNYSDNAYTELDDSLNSALEQCSTKEQEDAFFNLESALNRITVLESEKHFIGGFITGYKFLKEIGH